MSWSIGIEEKKEEEVRKVIALREKSKRKEKEKEEMSIEQAVEDVTIAEGKVLAKSFTQQKNA